MKEKIEYEFEPESKLKVRTSRDKRRKLRVNAKPKEEIVEEVKKCT